MTGISRLLVDLDIVYFGEQMFSPIYVENSWGISDKRGKHNRNGQ